MNFVVQCPRHVEDLLADEIHRFGGVDIQQKRTACLFSGSIETAYRIWFWSRIATRLLMPLIKRKTENKDQLYELARSIPWQDYFSVDQSFAISATTSQGTFGNPNYLNLVVKDAISDTFRNHCAGRRPSVDRTNPTVRIHLFIRNFETTINLDPSDTALHQRSYRPTQYGTILTPLKENIAAALLMRAKWPETFENNPTLLDPFCGSGTILIEAALMAMDIAPGLLRNQKPSSAIRHWSNHNPQLWEEITKEAEERRLAGYKKPISIFGSDTDKKSVQIALASVSNAKLDSHVTIKQQDLISLKPPTKHADFQGLIATNPPYGIRTEDSRKSTGQTLNQHLEELYANFGNILKQRFRGWKAIVLTSPENLGHAIKLRAHRINKIDNGRIPCQMLHFDLYSDTKAKAVESPALASTETKSSTLRSLEAEQVKNRLTKNVRRIMRWANRHNINCYRLYDADLPSYNISVDWFENRWAHIQEYAPPKEISEQKAKTRLNEFIMILQEVINIKPNNIFIKTRSRQRGRNQYTKQATLDIFHTVNEGSIKYLVNFSDYIDVGLFLDQRELRNYIRQHSKAKHFLNLFSYTGTATVAAVLGGAKSTTSVDSSRTYLDWSHKNLTQNGVHMLKNSLEQKDCFSWLESNNKIYDLIFLSPPTFSNSKNRQGTFDVQRDYLTIIELAIKNLSLDGTLLFSTNFRRFKFDQSAVTELGLSSKDLSASLVPLDFSRRTRNFHIWKLNRTIEKPLPVE